MARLDELATKASDDLAGLRRLLSQEYVIQTHTREVGAGSSSSGVRGSWSAGKSRDASIGERAPRRTVSLPARSEAPKQLDRLIRRLEALKDLALYNDIEVTITIQLED